MKYKIGIFGSSAGEMTKIIPMAQSLGHELGKYNDDVIIITGAASGLPYQVASIAYQQGVKIWGYSSNLDLKSQKQETPEQNFSIYKRIIYVPTNFPCIKDTMACKKYRNVISTANCDAGIIISGRWGTMNEFTNLHDLGKVIGILTGTGGIADELINLNKKIHKQSKAQLIFEDSPKRLVTAILKALNERNKN